VSIDGRFGGDFRPDIAMIRNVLLTDLKPEQWERMKKEFGWNEVEMRDNRYNQVIHLVSAAKGAEDFYGIQGHVTRYEGLELARHLDDLTSQAWVGHPYYDVIDNNTDFERKVVRTIAAVCNRLCLDAGDRLSSDARKRKFLVTKLPEEEELEEVAETGTVEDEAGIPMANVYRQFQDFIVVHDYLVTPNSTMQARIRRRGQNGALLPYHVRVCYLMMRVRETSLLSICTAQMSISVTGHILTPSDDLRLTKNHPSLRCRSASENMKCV